MAEERTCCGKSLDFWLVPKKEKDKPSLDYELAMCEECHELYAGVKGTSVLFKFEKRTRNEHGYSFSCTKCKKDMAHYRQKNNRITLYCPTCERAKA